MKHKDTKFKVPPWPNETRGTPRKLIRIKPPSQGVVRYTNVNCSTSQGNGRNGSPSWRKINVQPGPKGHAREIAMFNPFAKIPAGLSGSALHGRHSIVSRNVNLHRCQAQDIISGRSALNGPNCWSESAWRVSRRASDRPGSRGLREMNLATLPFLW